MDKQSILKTLKQGNLDNSLSTRIAAIFEIAHAVGEWGIVAWVARAVQDAVFIGRLRDRDMSTLIRLEKDFNREFYREYRSTERATGEQRAFVLAAA